MKSLTRFVHLFLMAAMLLAPVPAFAQSAPSPQFSIEASVKALRDGLLLNEEQAMKVREVLNKRAATIEELRQRARKQPFSQKLQVDVQRELQALRDEIAVFLTDEQREKLPRVDPRLAIPLPPGFVFIPIPPRLRDAGSTGVAPEPLISVAPAGASAAGTAKSRTPRVVEDWKILHLLNRLTFGPRPGDVERVRKLGIDQFIAEQLNAQSIDDSELERRLVVLPTLQMTQQELYTYYPPAQVADQRYGQSNQPPIYGRPQQIYGELVQQKLVRAVSSHRQLQEVMTDFWFNHFNVFAQKEAVQWMVTGYERDVIRPNSLGKFRDLLLAVAESPAMLFYLDNWLSAAPDSRQPRPPRPQPPPNANPAPPPGPPGTPGTPDTKMMGENRPESPRLQQPQQPPSPPPQQRRAGINENYARELMELHTLGVDGGYTQKDVQEVARAFTGWTIDRPYQGGGYVFRPWMHDNGAKTVLGIAIPAGGGISDGRRVLEILSRHPATARFISKKLCQRFVGDKPSPQLVERVAQVFVKTDGEIKEVLKAIFIAPEFLAPATFRSKVKSPLELAASAIRALDGDTSGTPALHDWLRKMGEPLYQQQAPTGYDENSAEWMNTGVFLNRINFGVALAANQIAQTAYAPARLVSAEAMTNGDLLMKELTALLTHTELSAESKQAVRASLAEQAGQPLRVATQANPPARSNAPTLTTADLPRDNPRRIAQVIGVLLGTAEFQKK